MVDIELKVRDMSTKLVPQDVKLAVVGNDTVGKTSLANRFIYDVFHPVYVHTRGGDIHTKQIKSERHIVNLKLVDTAGHIYQREVIPPLYQEADGIIVTYDVTNEKSFHSLSDWVECARKVKSAEVVIVGNKLDLCAEKEEELLTDVKKFADNHGLRCYLVSAKYNHNVNRVFKRLIREVLRKRLKGEAEMKPSKKRNNNDISCCLVC